MAKALKTHKEKAEFATKLARIRPYLPSNATDLLTTLRPDLNTEHVYNVLRNPIRRYDDEILSALVDLAAPRQRARKAVRATPIRKAATV